VYVYMYVCICVRMYTSPYAFLRRVGMHSQVLLSTMHMQVCMLDRCCEHQRTHLLHARYRMCICAKYIHVYMHICMYIFICMHVYIYTYMYVCIYMYMRTCMDVYICVCVCVCVCVCAYICICMCVYIYISLYVACMCSLFHLALGNEDEGVQLVCESACCLAWGVILSEGKIGVLSVSSLCLTRVGVYVGVCVCIRTNTHTLCTDGVLGCEPRSRDETRLK